MDQPLRAEIAKPVRIRGCCHRPADGRPGSFVGHRSRYRVKARHRSCHYRQHAIRRFRSTPDQHDVYTAQPVSRDSGSWPAISAKSEYASESLHSGECIVRHLRPRSCQLIFIFWVRVCRIECNDHLRDVHAFGLGSSSNTNSTTAMSNAVPLSAFTHFRRTSEALSINHQGQFPSVTVSFNLAPNAALGSAISAIDKVQSDMHMPASLQADFQGTAASFKNSLSNEALLILAALVTVYIVLGVLYESFIHPVTILSTLPSAGVGALLALMLFGQDLSVVAIIGIILLIGIVKKNGIMMVDFALEGERQHGKNATDAIYEASLLRFRPIMMTTMAALLGGIPLAVGTGIGSEIRRPLGIAMVGGLLLSQALTLYTTPVIYIFFDNLGRRFSGSRSGETSGEKPGGTTQPAEPA